MRLFVCGLVRFVGLVVITQSSLACAVELFQTEAIDSSQAQESVAERFIRPPIRHYVVGQGETLGITPELSGKLSLRALSGSKQSLDFSARAKLAKEKLHSKVLEHASAQKDRYLPCFESKTDRQDVGPIPGVDPELVLIDYLFVTPDDLPKDSASPLGSRVMVFIYDLEDSQSPVVDIARGMGVPCVPFRIRGTARHVYHHYGKDALRSFEGF